MKLLKTYIFPFALTMLLFSCGGSPKADNDLMDLMEDVDSFGEDEVVDKTPVEVDWDELISKDLKDGQNVIFEGYVGMLPTTMYSYDNREITVDFYPRRNQIHGEKMRVDITIGTSPAHVRSLPEEYAQEDLKIICEEEKTAGVGSYVRIEGAYSNSTADNYNYADLTKISIKEDAFDESILETAVELTNEIIEDTTLEHAYTYMDVSFSTSMYMSPWSGRYAVNTAQKNNTYLKTAYINIGTKPGNVEQLNDGFTDKDFIIYDYKGEAQKASSGKFRIYGTFNPLEVEAKGTFSVEEIKKL